MFAQKWLQNLRLENALRQKRTLLTECVRVSDENRLVLLNSNKVVQSRLSFDKTRIMQTHRVWERHYACIRRPYCPESITIYQWFDARNFFLETAERFAFKADPDVDTSPVSRPRSTLYLSARERHIAKSDKSIWIEFAGGYLDAKASRFVAFNNAKSIQRPGEPSQAAQLVCTRSPFAASLALIFQAFYLHRRVSRVTTSFSLEPHNHRFVSANMLSHHIR